MFQWFITNRNYRAQAKKLYQQAVVQSRRPDFYTAYAVPDTFDGRFEMLCLHVDLIMRHLDNTKLKQVLFNVMFRDMDRSLREAGVGDLAVPKHMKRMMRALKGRCFYYDEALQAADKEKLKSALRRNAYGTMDDVNASKLNQLANYVIETDAALSEVLPESFEDIFAECSFSNEQELKYAS